ncbi:PhzF family phenazine biosynthesis protein [Luteococcus sp. OSA5]|uniref:PhzF family phenazine biosynthesis protein n=1 Tax=Luteococcus sp. OSA5 TaxID=3401630 RepID=UPI003B436602
MQHRYLEVDVFSTGPFTGNPVAVIADADELSEDQMRAIAHWTNLSETTFLIAPTTDEADYRVRIFTPSTEFPFAGHPTLGTARAWLELGGRPRTAGQVVQECGAGLVQVRLCDQELSFATPPRTRTGELDEEDVERLVEALGLRREDVLAHAWGVNGPAWQLFQLRDADLVRFVRPGRLWEGAHIGLVGLETGEGENLLEVRGLTEHFEDPVTGSLNGAFAQWLRERGLVPAHYVAHQGSQVRRAGRVRIEDDGCQIWVGGSAEVRVRGELVS